MVSPCKNARSAHDAEGGEVLDEGRKERRAPRGWETPIAPQGERVFWSIFIYFSVPHLSYSSLVFALPACTHFEVSEFAFV